MVPLSERIFDDDAGTQVLALDVLKRYSRHTAELEEILKGLRVEARVGTRSHVRRRVAARALGELRDQKALELLIDLLATSEPELVSAAHRALVTLTRQDFGDSMRRWQAWAERNSERHRIEWLIDGLLHNEETIRAAAADELKTLTQEYFGYHPASPKKDREIAQRKYRAWWESDGRRRFGS
jgi:HEAT repeat protein